MNLKPLLGAFPLVVLSSQALAGPIAYATNYHHDLMRIDFGSPAAVLIGTIGFTAEGLAATSSGKLYATDASGGLHDVTGGGNSLVANLGSVSVGSMDSSGSTLWAYDNLSQRLFEYDPGTNSVLQWSSVLGIPSLKALTIDASGNFLFVAKVGSVDKFGKIVKATWATSVLNPNMGLADDCEAMDFLSDGNLYAAVFGDTRYRLDPTNGTVISSFNSGTHRDWSDMTSPTPEPVSMLGIGIGVMGLLAKRRRR